MSRLRLLLLIIVRPITRLMNKVNIRIGKPRLTGKMYREAMLVARKGDIILTRTALRPSNVFIPGKWSHAHIIVDHDIGSTVEAVIPTSRESTFIDIWAGVTEIIIVRPKFASMDQRYMAADRAATMINVPYDTSFGWSNKAFYCSELVIKAYKLVGVKVPMKELTTRISGNNIVTPSALAGDNFIIIWESSKK